MSNMSVENRIDQKVLEDAAEHYLSLQEDSMSGAELKAWQAWFMRSKDHQLAFRRLESLWGALEDINLEELQVTVERIPVQQSEQDQNTGASVLEMIAPAKETRKSTSWRSWVTGMAAGFAVLFVAGYMLLGTPNEQVAVEAVPYHTAAGEQRVVNLADGSILELGPDSEVAVSYSREERGLSLVRGQAIFTVAKNANRPFVVRAGNGSVTAIGTVFNVRRHDGDVRVRVMEGTVAVRPRSEEGTADQSETAREVAFVTAGNQTEFDQSGAMSAIERADVQSDMAWRIGVLTMVNRELSDVIQEVNRFLQNEVAIGDDAIGKFHFTGTVYPDRIDEWLEGLTQGYPLKVVEVGGRTILMLDDSETTH